MFSLSGVFDDMGGLLAFAFFVYLISKIKYVRVWYKEYIVEVMCKGNKDLGAGGKRSF